MPTSRYLSARRRATHIPDRQAVTLQLLASQSDDIIAAASLLAAGGLVAVPTETVYGLGADASNDASVRRVFAVKGRPVDHPLILHVSDLEHARNASAQWTTACDLLAREFWPGPLSILTTKSQKVSDVVTGGRSTVVIRIPDNEATLSVIARLHSRGSVGLAAPSANRFGEVSPTTAEHVLRDLGGEIDAVLNDGPCRIGLESTIIDCRGRNPVLLREGGLTFERLRGVLQNGGFDLERAEAKVSEIGQTGSIAPGMLASHYAPRSRVEVFDSETSMIQRVEELKRSGDVFAFLPHPSDPEEYSRGLYASLRTCDAKGVTVILALLPPPEGIGAAVRDRLLRAAAPRPD